jgi:hypothetical protein
MHNLVACSSVKLNLNPMITARTSKSLPLSRTEEPAGSLRDAFLINWDSFGNCLHSNKFYQFVN